MRIALVLFVLLVVATVSIAVAMRLVTMPAADWHIDPETATPPDTPNFILLTGPEAPVVELPPIEVAARLNEIALSERAVVIGGSIASGFVTYVVRSRLMGYPDAISVRFRPEGTGTAIDIFSRSRFGHSDLGVNAARIDRWLAAVSEG